MVKVNVSGRVLDKEFEDGIRQTAKEVGVDVDRAIEIARVNYALASKMGTKEEKKFEGMVKEHPMAFVVGAFVGGLVVGAMIAKRG